MTNDEEVHYHAFYIPENEDEWKFFEDNFPIPEPTEEEIEKIAEQACQKFKRGHRMRLFLTTGAIAASLLAILIPLRIFSLSSPLRTSMHGPAVIGMFPSRSSRGQVGDADLRRILDGESIQKGDRINKIGVKFGQETYFYVFQVEASGDILCMFPNLAKQIPAVVGSRKLTANPLPANQQVTIILNSEINEGQGEEWFVTFAYPEPIPEVERVIRDLAANVSDDKIATRLEELSEVWVGNIEQQEQNKVGLSFEEEGLLDLPVSLFKSIRTPLVRKLKLDHRRE